MSMNTQDALGPASLSRRILCYSTLSVRLLSTTGRDGLDLLELEFILTRVLVAYAIPGN